MTCSPTQHISNHLSRPRLLFDTVPHKSWPSFKDWSFSRALPQWPSYSFSFLAGSSRSESVRRKLILRNLKLYNTGGRMWPPFDSIWCILLLNCSWHCSLSLALPHSSSCSTHYPPFVNLPFHLHLTNLLPSHLLILSAVLQILAPFIILHCQVCFCICCTRNFSKKPLLLCVIVTSCHTYK